MSHRIIIGIGSNEEGEQNLATAQRALLLLFDSLRFSTVVQTEPVDFPNPAPFYNQVAVGLTKSLPDEVRLSLKQIEQETGRSPEKANRHLIPIDLDLLQWDTKILKPDDLQRDYIRKALQELSRTDE